MSHLSFSGSIYTGFSIVSVDFFCQHWKCFILPWIIKLTVCQTGACLSIKPVLFKKCIYLLWLCLTKLLACDLEQTHRRQTRHVKNQQRERWTDRPTEQQAAQHRLHNNDFFSFFFSTVQPACLLICGRGWLRDNANSACAGEQILRERMLLPWQEIEREKEGQARDGERWVTTEKQRLEPKQRRGFIHLQSEEKDGIIDESAAYTFF